MMHERIRQLEGKACFKLRKGLEQMKTECDSFYESEYFTNRIKEKIKKSIDKIAK